MSENSEISERYRRVADRFTARVNEVPDDSWDNPAPCEGWVARDVVRHLVEWIPAFLTSAGGPTLPDGPSVDVDPAGAWTTLNDGIQSLLDDPDVSASTISHPRAGTHRLDEAIATFFLGDVVVHTWDLARATGLERPSTPTSCTRCSSVWSPWTRPSDRAASTDRRSMSPPTPTSSRASSHSPVGNPEP